MLVLTNHRNEHSHHPKDDRDRSNRLLHRSIDSYHQSLAKKPDDPFASEMLQKALGDALEQTDFFLDDDDMVNVNNNTEMHNSSAVSALPSPAGAPMYGNTPTTTMSSRRQNHHHHHQQTATTDTARRSSLGSHTSLSTTTGIGGGDGGGGGVDQSSLWTEDGLSLSVESNDDVDMMT